MKTETLESALETAACLWEAVLTLRDHPATEVVPFFWTG